MTREETIKYIQEWLKDEYALTAGDRAALNTAIEALKAPEWIPVSENPKQEKKEYLIQTDSGYICVCRWTNANHFWTDLTTDWHWNIHDIPQYSKVVAWREKPEPYKGGDTE